MALDAGAIAQTPAAVVQGDYDALFKQMFQNPSNLEISFKFAEQAAALLILTDLERRSVPAAWDGACCGTRCHEPRVASRAVTTLLLACAARSR